MVYLAPPDPTYPILLGLWALFYFNSCLQKLYCYIGNIYKKHHPISLTQIKFHHLQISSIKGSQIHLSAYISYGDQMYSINAINKERFPGLNTKSHSNSC